MSRYCEGEVEAMAERERDEREADDLNRIQELIVCKTVNDLKHFIMKHLIGV